MLFEDVRRVERNVLLFQLSPILLFFLIGVFLLSALGYLRLRVERVPYFLMDLWFRKRQVVKRDLGNLRALESSLVRLTLCSRRLFAGGVATTCRKSGLRVGRSHV